jgi:hypothetical protein
MVQIKKQKQVTVLMCLKSGFGTRISEHPEGSPQGSRERTDEGHWSGYESEGRERHYDALVISSLFSARTAI